jgi:hypothetical protein
VSALADRLSLSTDRLSLCADRLSLSADRVSLFTDRLSASGGRLSASADRLSLSADRLSLSADRLSLSADRLSAWADRLSAWADRLSLAGGRVSLSADRLSLSGGRLSASADRLSMSGDRLSASSGQLSADGPGEARIDRVREGCDRQGATGPCSVYVRTMAGARGKVAVVFVDRDGVTWRIFQFGIIAAPARARAQDPQHALEAGAIIDPGTSTGTTTAMGRPQRRDPRPRRITHERFTWRSNNASSYTGDPCKYAARL